MIALKRLLLPAYLACRRAWHGLLRAWFAAFRSSGPKRTFKAFGYIVTEQTENEYALMCYTGDLNAYVLYRSAIERFCPAEPVVLDVGANIGICALSFSRVPGSTVYAFEPVRRTFDFLAGNIEANGIKNIHAFNMGLSDTAGAARIGAKTARATSGGYGVLEEGTMAAGYAETVTLSTIDTFVAEHNLMQVDYIKIDVEGWETNVLKGAQKTIAEHAPVIQFEAQAANMSGPAFDRPFLEAFVRDGNFDTFFFYKSIRPLADIATLLDDPKASVDVLLVPRHKPRKYDGVIR